MLFQVVVIHESDDLPGPRGAKFVVSVCNNKSSTKAFLDALALSTLGDTIEVPLRNVRLVHRIAPHHRIATPFVWC